MRCGGFYLEAAARRHVAWPHKNNNHERRRPRDAKPGKGFVLMTPHELSAVELLAGYRARKLSPVEAMKDVLERVERFEPHIRATYLLNPERALAEATASEQRWMRGEPVGPLDGVPTTVKDNIATKGEPTPLGTAASDLSPAAADAPPAARLREAGAIIFSKTTMPDYGMLSSGLSSFHPQARNPWSVSRNPGGSSAGAGAAAAAGYGPLHLGTDIGGSVRLPAGWCGIFALKPSLGRVPIDPPFLGRAAGPMTRSVDDAALMMGVLSRPDARDYMNLPPQEIDWRIKPAEIRGLKIGIMLDAGSGAPPTSEVRAAVETAARDLALAGAIIEPVATFLSQKMLDGWDRFFRMRSHLDLLALPAERREKILPFIRAWAGSAASLSGEEVFGGFNEITAMRQTTIAKTAAYDFVLSPTAPMVAFPAEDASPSQDPLNPFPHIGFTLPFSVSEQPAASINCGYSKDGLPIGLQIIGRRFDDVGVLALARAFEEMRRALARPWPEPPGA
jgi:amidase/aspartyl-tRNA(Asn)/glutamyl-tRNA(Gln) amidotransferase subunit A